MFTGIISEIGTVRKAAREDGGRLEISCGWETGDIALGASIACNGICLTVIEKGKNWFAVDASEETAQVTTLGNWKEGARLNLERALRAGDELGGHFVSGHIDATGTIRAVLPEGDSHLLRIEAPGMVMKLVAAKGSICIDGVSLTVNKVANHYFETNIIPHTWQCTTLGQRAEGDKVNLEIDLIARYVARIHGAA